MTWDIIDSNKTWVFEWVGTAILLIVVGIIWFFIKRYFFAGSSNNSKNRVIKNSSNTEILFIEDWSFPIIENLKKIWYKTKKITDLQSMDDSNLSTADIVFVDIRWVWKKLWLSDQWFWIVRLIREKFHNSKKIVIYSWEESRVNSSYKLADDALDKDSNLTEFKATIDKLIESINHA